MELGFANIKIQNENVAVKKVLKNMYILLAASLAFSSVTAYISSAIGIGVTSSLILTVIGFALLFVINKTADKASGIFWAFLFAGVMGASLGSMISKYLAIENGNQLIMQAMGTTALIFFALSAYAISSSRDFSFMAGGLVAGVVVVIIAMVANLFLQIPLLQVVISSVVVLIMSGFILYDTSRIVNGGEKNYIRAAVSIYLSIFNLFVHLLSLFNILDD